MVIGIIGAGISGLIAGKLLAKAGHEVTILEKSRGYGGRMATRYVGKNKEYKLDHGLTHFTIKSPEFQSFTVELLEKKLIKLWGENIHFYDGEQIFENNPNTPNTPTFTAVNGMNTIGKYLARSVDVKTNTLVGGLTYIGKNRTKKRSWMVNLSAGNTFEADAIILATPAPQAYGILQTTVDETDMLKIIRQIDEVNYKPAYSLMLGFKGKDLPEWEGIICNHKDVDFISNESSKRSTNGNCSLIIQSTETFAREHRNSDTEFVAQKLHGALTDITGGWASSPEWSQLHFWKFSRALQTIKAPFLEYEEKEVPLALVGDYFEGNTVDDAYKSVYKLAQKWIRDYPIVGE